MYVSPMLICFWRGKSTPAIRAIVCPYSGAGLTLPLALLMFRVDADHPHHTFAVDNLALVTDFLNRCSYFHNQFLRNMWGRAPSPVRRAKPGFFSLIPINN